METTGQEFWDMKWGTTPLSRPMVFEHILRVIGDKKRVLDVGGGNGDLARDLTEIRSDPTVFELSQVAAGLCEDKGIKTVVGSLPRLPFASKSFDYAVAVNVMEFIPDLGTFVKELARVAPKALIAVPRDVTASAQQVHVFKMDSFQTLLRSGYPEVYMEVYTEREVLNLDGAYRTIPSVVALCCDGSRPKKSIMVAVPNIGYIRNGLADRLMSLQHFGHSVQILPTQESYGKPIDFNRTQIVRKFLESGLDYLLMIDSDLIPPSNIMLMVDNGLDICSADIRTYQDGVNLRIAMTFLEEHEKYDDYKAAEIPEMRISEVDACGTGCLLVHRKVFEKVPEFRGRAEDYNFCRDAKKAGFKVYFDTRFRCHHYVTIPV